MKKLYLHIGLHKTGSTALQSTLLKHQTELESNGYFLPEAGRNPQPKNRIVHSNISWDILGARSFSGKAGGLSDVVQEIQDTEIPNCIITDEGLSRLRNPKVLTDRFPHLNIVVIAFTRNPLSAAGSLYSEHLKFGETGIFDTWLKGIGRRMLSHSEIVKRWEALGLNVRQSDIDEIKNSDRSLAETFSGYLDLQGSFLSDTHGEAVNARISFQESLALFYANNILKSLNRSDALTARTKVHRLVRKRVRDTFSKSIFPFSLAETQLRLVADLFDISLGTRPDLLQGSAQSVTYDDCKMIARIARTAVEEALNIPKSAIKALNLGLLIKKDFRNFHPLISSL